LGKKNDLFWVFMNMKKILRLTESELVRLVKKVIKEQSLLLKLPIEIQSAIKKLEQTYKVKIEDSNIQSELSQEGNYYPDNGSENPQARQQINKLVAKIHQLFPKTRNLGVISGYRGYVKQLEVFGRHVVAQGGVSNRQKNVTLPGFSQHHTGKAFDILSVEPTWWNSNPDVKKWVAENVGNYGFKVSYPNPGVLRNEEPWHLFYIGGNKMNENDLRRLVIKEQEDDDRPLNSKKFMFDDSVLLLKGASSKTIQHYLSQLPDTIRFITIVNGESADFSDVNVCGLDELYLVNLMNTPNNFEDTVDCDYDKVTDFMYDFDIDDDEDDEVSFRDDDRE
jgi:LAS superfamily LD-carboxypeptidase LdcB